MELPSQILDFNPIEMLWHDLKHAQKPSIWLNQNNYAKKEWTEIAPHQRERRIDSYNKCLTTVLAVKVDTTTY